MSPDTGPPASAEHPLVAYPGRDLALTAVTVLLTAAVLAVVAARATLPAAQRLDDSWLRLMATHRSGPVTGLAILLDVLGSARVTLPVRLAVVAFLALRRRWWHLSAFVAAVVASEVLIGTLKGLYDRARPAGSLVTTSGASFPSGHAVATSITVVAAVIALLPPGRTRARWGAAAVAFSLVMALSRAYLGAHWLSDAVAGVLLGTSCALVAALAVGGLQGRAGQRGLPEPAPATGSAPRSAPSEELR